MIILHKDFGPFAIAREQANNFCHNLFLSNAMNQCVLQMAKIEKEYHLAVLKADDELAKRKRLELQAFQSSLTLTAHMFDEIDEVSA